MKTYTLVTGGAGFIGRHLCAALAMRDHNVLCLDISPDAVIGPNITYVQGDVRDTEFVKSVSTQYSVNAVYHLASPASPTSFESMPVFVLTTNVVGTMNIMEQFARRQGARVLFTSTSEIYGDPTVRPQPETYFGNVNPIGPRACYDEGKRAGEALCISYAKQYHTDHIITRLFNVYGPGMKDDDGRVVPSFIRAALDNAPITIFGDGTQTRSFVYIDDVVFALMRVMESRHSGPYNIGVQNEMTILDLACTIIHLTKSTSELVFKDQRVDDPSMRCPDTRKIFRDFTWQGFISLGTGLQETIDSVKALDRARNQ